MDIELIKRAFEENKFITAKEISEKFNLKLYEAKKLKAQFSKITFSEYMANRNKSKCSEPLLLSSEVDQIILGSLLGDGCIIKKSNGMFTINHSLVQKEYAMYKYELLKRFGLEMKIREATERKFESYIEGRKIKDNGFIKLESPVNRSFNVYREEWYKHKKIVPDSICRLGPLGLAIWFMDDGSSNKSSYYLSTNGFEYDDVKKLTVLLHTNFGIYSTIHVNKDKFIIYIQAKSRELFTEIVKDYLCPSMLRKIYTKTKIIGYVKQGELLENPTTEIVNEDNQQPSLSSNAFEGSETNSRILPGNAEDSNTNTSALLITISDDEDIVRTI